MAGFFEPTAITTVVTSHFVFIAVVVCFFFHLGQVDSPLFEPAVDSRSEATAPSTKSGLYKPATSGATSSSTKAAASSSGASASRGFGSSSAASTGRPASRRASSIPGTSGTLGTSGTSGTVGNAGTVGFSSRRKSLAHEAGGQNRLELSPVYEGGVHGGAFATSPTSSPAPQGRVSAGMGGASASQVLLPPRTPHAAAAAAGGAGSAAAASSAAAVGTTAPVSGGAGIVHTSVGGIAMETPRCGTAGPRVRGGVRGHGHGEGDESWSEDDGNHSGGGAGRGMGDRIGQPHGSWGGCSTIKRRADEMVDHTHGVFTGHGGRGIGVAHRGSADDDGNTLGRGFPNRSRMSSSSISSSLSSGGETSARSTVGTGDEAEGGLGARQTPHDGWRRGGDGNASGVASGGAVGARERYGRGGSVGSASGGGGGGRGRVDYHSLCFSSSSSGYSASSSSPFGLLDRDSSNSEI